MDVYRSIFLDAIGDLSGKLLELVGAGKGMKVLELGCGAGGLAPIALRLGVTELVGIDDDARLVAEAKDRAEREGLSARFEVMDASALSFPNDTFDIVCCQLGLSKMRSPLAVLGQVNRVLKPGGRFGVIVPGSNRFDSLFTSAAGASSAGRAVDGDCLFAFSRPERLEGLLSFAGLEHVFSTAMNGVIRVADATEYWSLVASATGWTFPVDAAPPAPPLQVSADGSYIAAFELLLAFGRRSATKRAAAPETWKRRVDRVSEQIEELSPEEVRDRLERRTCAVIDIREPIEAVEILPGASLIPRGRLEQEMITKFPDVTLPIVLYSGRGERSAIAAATLERAGYRNVFSMEGGFQRWKELSFPTQPC